MARNVVSLTCQLVNVNTVRKSNWVEFFVANSELALLLRRCAIRADFVLRYYKRIWTGFSIVVHVTSVRPNMLVLQEGFVSA